MSNFFHFPLPASVSIYYPALQRTVFHTLPQFSSETYCKMGRLRPAATVYENSKVEEAEMRSALTKNSDVIFHAHGKLCFQIYN